MDRFEKVKTYVEMIEEENKRKEMARKERERQIKLMLNPFVKRVTYLVDMVNYLHLHGVKIPEKFMVSAHNRYHFELDLSKKNIVGVEWNKFTDCLSNMQSFMIKSKTAIPDNYCYSYRGNFTDNGEEFMKNYNAFEKEVFDFIDELTKDISTPQLKTYSVEYYTRTEIKANSIEQANQIADGLLKKNSERVITIYEI